MNIEEIKQEFISILESIPGVKKIFNEECNMTTDICYQIKVEQVFDGYIFMAHILVLPNIKIKELITNIGESLRYSMKKKKIKVSKLNIFVEGITNE